MTKPLDSTKLASFAACPRRFYYRHVLNWTSKRDAGPAIAFGSAWHKAMDVIWTELCGKPAADDYAAKEQAMLAFLTEWSVNNMPTSLASMQAAITDAEALEEAEKRMKFYWPDTARNMLDYYVDKHRLMLSRSTLVGVEVPFKLPLTAGQPREVCGLIDKIITTPEGHTVPLDHKTTAAFATAGGFRYDWLDKWTLTGQFTQYVYAVTMLTGKPTPFAIVDASLVHKTHWHHHRQIPLTITPQDVEAWLEDVEATAARIDSAAQTGQYEKLGPLNGNCSSPSECRYKNLCAGGFDWRNGALPSDMQIKPWDPVEETKDAVE